VLTLRHEGLSLMAGLSVYTAGIVVRFPYRNNTDSLGLFLIQNLCIILSPCAFIGVFNYLSHLSSSDRDSQHLLTLSLVNSALDWTPATVYLSARPESLKRLSGPTSSHS
jgi:hypothetical protein